MNSRKKAQETQKISARFQKIIIFFEIALQFALGKGVLCFLCLFVAITVVGNVFAGGLEDAFREPPESAKPWVYWYWMSSNVNKDGITRDLEAMAEVGIGGAYLMPINREGYEEFTQIDPPVNAPSDLFWEMVVHATREADRLGMRIAMNACDGWATAGGPWITPELSMQKVVWTSVEIEGGKPFNGKLEQAKSDVKEGPWATDAAKDYYRDIAVLAYPSFAAGKIDKVEGKAAFSWRRPWPKPLWSTDEKLPKEKCVPRDKIIDLTDKMDKSGKLNWTPPTSEKWLIYRFGYTTTGSANHPAGGGAVGLECDKFNPEAAKVQFDNWFKVALYKVGPNLAGRVLAWNHTDSWECGNQNWSPVFREEFTKRRGYDPVKYLPCMIGIPVGSAEESERFLWDIRRTVTDLISDSFFKTTVDLTHKYGAKFSAECVANFVVTDGLQGYRDVDFAMGEFWVSSKRGGPHIVHLKDAVSGGHIYGKNIIQAEAFTERGIKWIEDPYFLKPLGDYAFSIGINRYVLHVWPLQPFGEKVPGVTLFKVYGTFFSGNQTWHRTGKAWFDYVRRCQAMLQQGLPVVDVCYFVGEEIPNRSFEREYLSPKLADGYKYDCINADALLNRAEVKDGKIVMPDGMSYSLLVLPAFREIPGRPVHQPINKVSSPDRRMTPELASKIGSLAKAGAAVIGPKPKRSFSLHGYPESDKAVQGIVAESWGSVEEGAVPAEVLAARGLLPDVEFIGVDMAQVDHGVQQFSSPPFCFNHRRTGDADIYFVAHQRSDEQEVTVVFRVAGKQPELWHPETGKIRDLPEWEVKDGRTHVPLRFGCAESYFVVFKKEVQSSKLKVEGRKNFADLKEVQAIEGEWEVEFERNRGAPESITLKQLMSLSEHEDFGVKHFSGNCVYKKEFEYPISNKECPMSKYLDLGNVESVAQVTLNGQDMGTAWRPPYRVDVTGVLKEGKNTLEIKVANTWKNRLIGDVKQPDKRVCWTLFRDNQWFNAKSPLDPSGLIGPVRILGEN